MNVLIKKVVVRILNFFGRFRKYETAWVENLPEQPKKKVIYIIGGRSYPFYAAIPCSRASCKKIIHLEVSPDFKKRWKLQEHEDGSLSIYPSIDVIDSSCRCHYWIKKGHIIWSDMPPLCIPKENKTR